MRQGWTLARARASPSGPFPTACYCSAPRAVSRQEAGTLTSAQLHFCTSARVGVRPGEANRCGPWEMGVALGEWQRAAAK